MKLLSLIGTGIQQQVQSSSINVQKQIQQQSQSMTHAFVTVIVPKIIIFLRILWWALFILAVIFLFVGFSKIAKSYIAVNGEERKHGVNDVTTIIYTLLGYETIVTLMILLLTNGFWKGIITICFVLLVGIIMVVAPIYINMAINAAMLDSWLDNPFLQEQAEKKFAWARAFLFDFSITHNKK